MAMIIGQLHSVISNEQIKHTFILILFAHITCQVQLNGFFLQTCRNIKK